MQGKADVGAAAVGEEQEAEAAPEAEAELQTAGMQSQALEL